MTERRAKNVLIKLAEKAVTYTWEPLGVRLDDQGYVQKKLDAALIGADDNEGRVAAYPRT